MNVCPGCGRHCELSMPSCERGEEYARTGVMPERGEHGGHHPAPDMPGRFRHYGPASHEPHGGPHGEHGPHGDRPPHDGHGPHGDRPLHDGHGPHGGPHDGHGPRHPRGRITESPRYAAEDLNEKLLTMLRVLGHAGHHMEGHGGQTRILSILKDEGEMTQRELTGRLGIQPGSASEIIGKLERAGYLIRTPNPADRRTADISLTEAGAARAADAAERAQTHRAHMFSALTEEEKQALLPLLEKLYNAWEDDRPEHGPRHE